MQRQEIELYGRLAEPEGATVALMMPDEPTTMADVRARLRTNYPALGALLSHHRVKACLDDVMVSDDARVCLGQSIAFFPPVSGG